jgi:hypothetical protein
MRMWMVDPKKMCDKHLLGEHVELHMLVATINLGKSIKGYLNGLVDPDQIIARHALLTTEMASRKIKHKSPIGTPVRLFLAKKIDEEENLGELAHRCDGCACRIYANQIHENQCLESKPKVE